MPTESPSSTHPWKCKISECMFLCRVAMLNVCCLSLWCVSVWFISSWVWDFDLQQELGKPSGEYQAKSLAWEAIQSVPDHAVDKFDSVCFEIEARMDSCAAVLAALSCLSMNKFSSIDQKKIIPVCNRCDGSCKWFTLFFIRRLKINHKHLFLTSALSRTWATCNSMSVYNH